MDDCRRETAKRQWRTPAQLWEYTIVNAPAARRQHPAAGDDESELELPKFESHRGLGSTEDVDYWTTKDVREVTKSHVNYVVADTKKWEQQAAYIIDRHEAVCAFVKNAGLGFFIPYSHNGQRHDYLPDFIIRLNTEEPCFLILETKGWDPLEEVKEGAAKRWVAAVNADGCHGHWRYAVAKRVEEVDTLLDSTRVAPSLS